MISQDNPVDWILIQLPVWILETLTHLSAFTLKEISTEFTDTTSNVLKMGQDSYVNATQELRKTSSPESYKWGRILKSFVWLDNVEAF